MTSFLIQVHLTLMLASLFVGSVGVAMVFIAHAREDNPRGLITLGSGNVSAHLKGCDKGSCTAALVVYCCVCCFV